MSISIDKKQTAHKNTESEKQNNTVRRIPKPLMYHISMMMNDLEYAQQNQNARRIEKMLSGIKKYQKYPYRQTATPLNELWRCGQMRILADCKNNCMAERKEPVLFVPSMVNASSILDLMPERSMVRWFAAQGQKSYLLDWGMPQDDRQMHAIDTVVKKRLVRAVRFLSDYSKQKVHLVGYCMGGLLSIAASCLMREKVASLTLLSTPWDFQLTSDPVSLFVRGNVPELKQRLTQTDTIPIHWIQSIFAATDPESFERRFTHFADMKKDGIHTDMFVAVEEWANGGVDLPVNLAWECLNKWYIENRPKKGDWLIDDVTIEPATIRDIPAMIVNPGKDKIVPAESMQAFSDDHGGCDHITPSCGHVGIIAGQHAINDVWQPMYDFVCRHSRQG